MPATRRSMAQASSPLKVISDNVPTPLNTPGKKVVALKAELEKKDAENEALRNSIAELTSALSALNVVKDKIDTEEATTAPIPARKKKDKNAPVAAKTAYKFWSDAHPNKSKQGDKVNMQQLWKECPQEIRQSYEAMAKADKARYNRELASYNEEKEALEMYYDKKKQDMAMEFYDAHITAQAALKKVDAEKKGKKCKKAKDPEAPKRPLSSYMYFVAEMRDTVTKENPNMTPKEVIKTLGEMWGKLEKGQDTKKYDDLAAEDRTRYEAEKKVYDALVEERNKQSEQEKLERLKTDKEEALKLLKSHQDAATATVAASIAGGKGAMKMVSVEEMSVVSELTNNGANTKPKKVKDPNAPKKPSSAYIYFTCENRNDIKSSMPEGTSQKDLLTEIGRQWKELSGDKKQKYVEMADADKVRYAKEMEKYTAEKK